VNKAKAWIAGRLLAFRFRKEIAMFGKSWKTTAAGITALIAALPNLLACFEGNFSFQCLSGAIGPVLLAIGLMVAKDGDVSNAPNPGDARQVP
jgi:hypothetical protein